MEEDGRGRERGRRVGERGEEEGNQGCHKIGDKGAKRDEGRGKDNSDVRGRGVSNCRQNGKARKQQTEQQSVHALERMTNSEEGEVGTLTVDATEKGLDNLESHAGTAEKNSMNTGASAPNQYTRESGSADKSEREEGESMEPMAGKGRDNIQAGLQKEPAQCENTQISDILTKKTSEPLEKDSEGNQHGGTEGGGESGGETGVEREGERWREEERENVPVCMGSRQTKNNRNTSDTVSKVDSQRDMKLGSSENTGSSPQKQVEEAKEEHKKSSAPKISLPQGHAHAACNPQQIMQNKTKQANNMPRRISQRIAEPNKSKQNAQTESLENTNKKGKGGGLVWEGGARGGKGLTSNRATVKNTQSSNRRPTGPIQITLEGHFIGERGEVDQEGGSYSQTVKRSLRSHTSKDQAARK